MKRRDADKLRLLEILRASHGRPCPTNAELAQAIDRHSAGDIGNMLSQMHQAGMIRLVSGKINKQVSAPDGSWATLPSLVRRDGRTGARASRAKAKASAPVGREDSRHFSFSDKAQTRYRTLPRVTDQAEAQRLIDAALAAGRVTVCPPRSASVPINNGLGFGK